MAESDQSEYPIPLVTDWLMDGHLTGSGQSRPMRLNAICWDCLAFSVSLKI